MSNQCEVARLLREIDMNYQAAQLGLSGITLGTSMHEFITARMERIELAWQELAEVLGEDEATRLVVEQLDKSSK